jgi:hypothetical protein
MANDEISNPWDPVNHGQINPHSSEGIVDRDVEPEHGIRRVISDFFKRRNIRKHVGTWKGVCLHSALEYYEGGGLPGYALSANLNKPVSIVAVIVRIPELDSLTPWPNKFGDPNELDEENAEFLGMHKVFRSPAYSFGSQMPAPGDIVEVDFEDRKKRSGGIYLGIVEKGIGTIPDRQSEDDEGESQQAFDSAGGSVNTVGDYPEETTQDVSDAETEASEQASDETGI